MNTEYVSAAKPSYSGAIFRGAVGATLPTDAKSAIDTETYKSLGYVSEDGVTNSNSPESDTEKAWGGDIVLTIQTSKEDTFGLSLIETLNKDVLATVYGEDNVTGDIKTGITVKANSTEAEEYAYIIVMIMRNGALKRICIPKGKITEVGEISYSDGESVKYEITITAMPDDSNNTHYEYIYKAA